ncbi:MAG: efflux RND transporter permease subunit, partial [bacterium]
ENSTVSAGNLETARGKVQVRVPGEFTNVNSIRDIVIKLNDGRPIRLSDVADVSDTFKDLTSVSRVNGQPCVSVNVHKRAGENADRMIKRVKKVLFASPLPPGLKITVVEDQSDMIRLMIEDLENNIISGFLLVVIVLFLFLGWRNSILVGLAIPFSMMFGFALMSVMGMSLNMIVLYSLVLTVGMLVDNAIVIVENTYRHHCDGEDKITAAKNGVAEVAMPVINSTLTTVAAFLPMLYWPGIMGQFMSFLPQTVIIVLMASLFVAMALNPAFCSVFITRPAIVDSHDEPGKWRRFTMRYEAVLRLALRHRWLCLMIGFAFLFFTMAMMARYSKGNELFPETSPRRASIDIRYPEGTDLKTTDDTIRTIERILAGYCRTDDKAPAGAAKSKGPGKDIKFYLSSVGSSAGSHLSSGQGAPHLGSIQMEFVDFAERQGDTAALIGRIRDEMGSFPGAQVRIEPEEMGPPTGAPVSIEIAGEDFDVLSELADKIKDTIRDIPGLVDLQDNIEDARPEIQFRVDRERAAMLDLDTASVGYFLRTAVNGEEVSKYRAGEDEYDITVRLRENQRQSVQLLKQVYIVTPGEHGVGVPLASLGAFSYEGGRGQILRKDQKRMVIVSGFTQGRGEDKIIEDVRTRLEAIQLPRGYTVAYAGDNQEKIEAGAFLLKAFLVALALIALLLIMEFNSILLPLIVMVSVILSIMGVMWSLMAFGLKFGVIMSGIAVISLAGVVVNNGIVLIDCILKRKAQGISATEAIVIGGRLRLRPVLLTAIATVVGLFPMAAGWSIDFHSFPPSFAASSETSAWWAPMAIGVIFGLGLATVLTLIQVPVMMSMIESLADFLRRRFGRHLESPPTPSRRPPETP